MRMLRKRTLGLCAALVLIGFASRSADAAPIFGAQLFYNGGLVTLTSLPASSAYESQLGLYDDTFTLLSWWTLVADEPAGKSGTFDPSAHGFAVGDELIFGINVVSDGGRAYFLGPESRNPDGVIHGMIDPASGIVVGFEDWFGGGDLDYNDTLFLFEGGIAPSTRGLPPPVPEPGTLALLALGLGGLRLARRRRT